MVGIVGLEPTCIQLLFQVGRNHRRYMPIEVCHIKPIRQFSEDTLLSVINDKTNLLLLCPNCHWEYDNK